jgi:hypothetical protein
VTTQEQRVRFLQGHLKEQRLQGELRCAVLRKPNCEQVRYWNPPPVLTKETVLKEATRTYGIIMLHGRMFYFTSAAVIRQF